MEKALQVFKILDVEGLVEAKISVERLEHFRGELPLANKRVAWDGVHEEKSPRDDAPEGKEEDQTFF